MSDQIDMTRARLSPSWRFGAADIRLEDGRHIGGIAFVLSTPDGTELDPVILPLNEDTMPGLLGALVAAMLEALNDARKKNVSRLFVPPANGHLPVNLKHD